jgi:hypothetical protein
MTALNEIENFHQQIKALQPKANQALAASLNDLDKQIALIENRPPQDTVQSFTRLYNAFASEFNILEDTDMPPTLAVADGVAASNAALKQLLNKWAGVKTNELAKLNDELKKAGLPAIEL